MKTPGSSVPAFSVFITIISLITMAIQNGTIVYLRSGGPAMTISGEDSRGYNCVWFEGKEFKQASIEEEALSVTPPSAPSAPTKPVLW